MKKKRKKSKWAIQCWEDINNNQKICITKTKTNAVRIALPLCIYSCTIMYGFSYAPLIYHLKPYFFCWAEDLDGWEYLFACIAHWCIKRNIYIYISLKYIWLKHFFIWINNAVQCALKWVVNLMSDELVYLFFSLNFLFIWYYSCIKIQIT